MKNARALLVVALVALFGLVAVGSLSAAAPAAYLPGITDTDPAPLGCVSCHTGDYAISKELAKVKGHPDVSKVVKSVPDGCAMCHKEGAKAGTLAEMVHTAHFGKGKDSVFVKNYAGSCLNCHSFKAGVMGFKKGPFS
jgi:hypothetical protein